MAADAVLGPLFARSARAAAAVPRPPDVPVVAFTNDRRAAEDGVYILGLAPAAQVDRAVAWALAQGHSRFGALAPRGPFGEAVAAALRESAARRGGAVGRVAFFAPEAADAPGPIESLAAAREDPAEGFDALLVAASGRALAALAPQLPYRGLDPADSPLLGTAQWRDPAILGEPALLGAAFAAPEEGPAFRAFAARYRDAFGAPPPPLAALAYDAAALAARLAEGAGGGGFAGLGRPVRLRRRRRPVPLRRRPRRRTRAGDLPRRARPVRGRGPGAAEFRRPRFLTPAFPRRRFRRIA